MVILTWQPVLNQIWGSPVTNQVRHSNLWTQTTNTIGSWPTMSMACVVLNPDVEDGFSLWNGGVFELPNMAVSPRWFYWILLPQKLQDIYFNLMIRKITSTMRSSFLEHGRLMSFIIKLWQVGFPVIFMYSHHFPWVIKLNTHIIIITDCPNLNVVYADLQLLLLKFLE